MKPRFKSNAEENKKSGGPSGTDAVNHLGMRYTIYTPRFRLAFLEQVMGEKSIAGLPASVGNRSLNGKYG